MSTLFATARIFPPVSGSPLLWVCVCLLSALTACQTVPTQDENFTAAPPPVPAAPPDMHAFAADGPLVGEVYRFTPQTNDTLSDVARNFGLGYQEMAIANPAVDPWLLRGDQSLLLPSQYILPDAQHAGIVLNLASMRLFYFPKHGGELLTFPVGIGRENWDTPLGLTSIVEKKAHPDWTPPPSIVKEHKALNDPLPGVVKSGPDNPLGDYAMYLGFKNFLIHGTNKPYGIGMQVSHGCIQLYPEDIETLFPKVVVGTPVRIVHQPYLATWFDNRLYVEAHPPLEKWAGGKTALQQEFRKKLEALAARHHAPLHWPEVQAVLDRADGIPQPLTGNGGQTTADEARQLAYPDKLRGAFTPAPVGAGDWSVRTAGLSDHDTAQKLAAMLNHQGPAISSYPVFADGQYQVVSGPFKDQAESEKVARQIQKNFEMAAEVVPPAEKISRQM